MGRASQSGHSIFRIKLLGSSRQMSAANNRLKTLSILECLWDVSSQSTLTESDLSSLYGGWRPKSLQIRWTPSTAPRTLVDAIFTDDHPAFGKVHTPVYVKPLLPPRQSRGPPLGLGFAPDPTFNFECLLRGKLAGSRRHKPVSQTSRLRSFK